MLKFSTLVKAIIVAGYTQDRVAELCGTSQPTIWRVLHKNQMPDYNVGSAIIELYDRISSPLPLNAKAKLRSKGR